MSRSSLNVRPLAVIGCEVVGLVDQALTKRFGPELTGTKKRGWGLYYGHRGHEEKGTVVDPASQIAASVIL